MPTSIRSCACVAMLLASAILLAEEPTPMPPSTGPNPAIPEPSRSLIPTVNVSRAVGWPDGHKPRPAPGFNVNAFATGLENPRQLYVLPNGDMLVAESNGRSAPIAEKGLRARAAKHIMRLAGYDVPSADRITLLRDTDNDGRADVRHPFIEKLRSPFGMALIGDKFYVANTDAVLVFDYKPGANNLNGEGLIVVNLPAGDPDRHWTRNLIASADGSRLYASVGSSTNVAEDGMELEEGRAAIWEIDPAAKTKRLFATGLRNAVGMAWEPRTGVLWAVVNERDELGSDLPPDLLTSVSDGDFYGWPYSYWGQNLDPRVKPQRPELVARSVVPDYALGAHVAPVGLAITDQNSFLDEFQYGAFIGEHGSWNRRPRAGYQVVFVPFADGKPNGLPIEILGGFVNGKVANGRPAGVAFDARGNLLVADDVGNTIWRVTPAHTSD